MLHDSFVAVLHLTNTGDIVATSAPSAPPSANHTTDPRVDEISRGFLVVGQADSALSATSRARVVDPATEARRRRRTAARDRGQIRTDFDDHTLVDMIYGTVLRRSLVSLPLLGDDPVDARPTTAFEGIGSPQPATVITPTSGPS